MPGYGTRVLHSPVGVAIFLAGRAAIVFAQ